MTEPLQDPAWQARVRAFSRAVGLSDEHDPLMLQAFTHRSLVESAPCGDNERLEFLGDSVLALLVTEHLYRTLPGHSEGQLTRLRQHYVSEPSLAVAAAALGLGELLAMAPGEDAAGGRLRPSTLSDVFEAVLGATYLGAGIEAAREFLERELIEQVDPTEMWDHKSRLQELYQEQRRLTPVYRTEVESGPSHDPVFLSEVLVGDEVLGRGTGRSKKAAEQLAAEDALRRTEPKRRPQRQKNLTKDPSQNR